MFPFAQVSFGKAVAKGVPLIPGREHTHGHHLPLLPHPSHARRHPPLLLPAGGRLSQRHTLPALQVQAGHLQLLPAQPLLVLAHDQRRRQGLPQEGLEAGIR